jgi:hypothetical protein
MSELRSVEHAEHTPGRCVRCSSHNGPFIDTGVETAVEGQVYVCFTCLDQMIALRGGASPEQVARFEALLNDADEKLSELRATMSERDRTLVADFADFLKGIEQMTDEEKQAAMLYDKAPT